MSLLSDKQQLLLLQKDDSKGYKKCIDCGAPYPQWASVSLGIMFCLECSGIHRSLGVHLSFVRSITMDKWSPDQIKKMQLGGNSQCLDFFAAQPEGLTIQEKYSSEYAKIYREKLTALCNGETWVMPIRNISANPSTSSPYGNISPGTVKPTSEIDDLKRRNEDYFSRKGIENETRANNLPPSQGGKYVGFGSNVAVSAEPVEEDPLAAGLAALSKGWDFLSIVAKTGFIEGSKIARTGADMVSENVIKPASEAINKDPQLSSFFNTVGGTVTTVFNEGSSFVHQGIQEGAKMIGKPLPPGYYRTISGNSSPKSADPSSPPSALQSGVQSEHWGQQPASNPPSNLKPRLANENWGEWVDGNEETLNEPTQTIETHTMENANNEQPSNEQHGQDGSDWNKDFNKNDKESSPNGWDNDF